MPKQINPQDIPETALNPSMRAAQININAASSIGAGGRAIGAAIADLGNAFGQLAGRAATAQDAQNDARFELEWWKAQNDIDKDISDTTPEDGSGWDAAPQRYQEKYKELDEKYPVSGEKRRLNREIGVAKDLYTGGRRALDNRRQGSLRVAIGTETKEIDGVLQRITEDPSQENYDRLMGATRQLIESGNGLYRTQAETEARMREVQGQVAAARFGALIKKDPEGAAKLVEELRKGKFEVDKPGGPASATRPMTRAPLFIDKTPTASERRQIWQKGGVVVNLDTNWAKGDRQTQPMVVIPDGATKEQRSAAQAYAQKISDVYAKQFGKSLSPKVVTRSENGLGRGYTIHTEPYAVTDSKAVAFFNSEQGQQIHAQILSETFGQVPGVHFSVPHDPYRKGDMGAAGAKGVNEVALAKGVLSWMQKGDAVPVPKPILVGEGELGPRASTIPDGVTLGDVIAGVDRSGGENPRMPDNKITRDQLEGLIRGRIDEGRADELLKQDPYKIKLTPELAKELGLEDMLAGAASDPQQLGDVARKVFGKDAERVIFVAEDQPETPLGDVLDKNVIAGLSERYGRDVSKMSVGQAVEMAQGMIGEVLPPENRPGVNAFDLPQGRFEQGQVFEMDLPKGGKVRFTAEELNAIDRNDLKAFAKRAKEEATMQRRMHGNIATDMTKRQLQAVERTGKSVTDYDQGVIQSGFADKPEKIAEYNRNLAMAKRVHAITSTMADVDEDTLQGRLDELEDEIIGGDGATAYENQALARVKRAVERNLRDRVNDPAKAVEGSGEVQAVRKALPDGQAKTAAQQFQLVDARMRAQVRLGMPPVPITRHEAQLLARDVIYAPTDKDKKAAASSLYTNLQKVYGSHAPAVVGAIRNLAKNMNDDSEQSLLSSMRRAERERKANPLPLERGDRLDRNPYDQYD